MTVLEELIRGVLVARGASSFHGLLEALPQIQRDGIAQGIRKLKRRGFVTVTHDKYELTPAGRIGRMTPTQPEET